VALPADEPAHPPVAVDPPDGEPPVKNAPPLGAPLVDVTAPPLPPPPEEAPPDPTAPSLAVELQASKPEIASDASKACLVFSRAVTVTVAENFARDATLNFDIARTVSRNWQKNNP